MKNVLTAGLLISVVAGCSVTGGIVPVNSGPSEFEKAVFKGQTTVLNEKTLSGTEYRIFNQGATGFVSAQGNRDDAEYRATVFCTQKGKEFRLRKESISVPPHILGNFPRAELTFECVDKAATSRRSTEGTTAASDSERYANLAKLKKLLDDGVVTQEEYLREKGKILNTP